MAAALGQWRATCQLSIRALSVTPEQRRAICQAPLAPCGAQSAEFRIARMHCLPHAHACDTTVVSPLPLPLALAPPCPRQWPHVARVHVCRREQWQPRLACNIATAHASPVVTTAAEGACTSTSSSSSDKEATPAAASAASACASSMALVSASGQSAVASQSQYLCPEPATSAVSCSFRFVRFLKLELRRYFETCFPETFPVC